MKLHAGGVVLVEVEVRAQRPRLVPRPVPTAHHVVRPLDPPGLGVEPPDVRLHLRPELAHVGALVVRVRMRRSQTCMSSLVLSKSSTDIFLSLHLKF